MAADVQDHVYMLDNDLGETVASRLMVGGQSRLLQPDHPCVPRLNCGSMQGVGVDFYNEHGEVARGVQVLEYHYFLDESNKIRPIPPGSVLQGWFNQEVEKNLQVPASNHPTPHQELEKNLQMPASNHPTPQQPPENNTSNQTNPVEQKPESSATLQQFQPTSESVIANDYVTSAEETQTAGSYYENVAQGMDIELEEEIISCAIPKKRVANKNAKVPGTRKVRKKKGSQVVSPKISNSTLNNQMSHPITSQAENQHISQLLNTAQFNQPFSQMAIGPIHNNSS